MEMRKTTGNSVYSKTSIIQTNWEQTLVQINEGPNYRRATESQFREVMKWILYALSGNVTLF
jgi:hypothetical protein